jgi:hypothetical protein
MRVQEKIGKKYLIPLLGVWKYFDEINFNRLPERFVLKATHGFHWNICVDDKRNMDFNDATKKFDEWIQINYAYQYGFKLQYRDIPPQIVAEEYLKNEGAELFDYKFWCFDGQVKYIVFVSGRSEELHKTFYDTDWNMLPYAYTQPIHEFPVERPANLKEMIHLAEILSKGFVHVRVDLYRLNDSTIKFGEMTFSSASGACKWVKDEYDKIFGDWIVLPQKKNG